MLIGYNTFDIFTALSTEKRNELKKLAGDVVYRYPGGARAAADYSFNKSYSTEQENPHAYIAEFAQFTDKGCVVFNLNAHLQFKNSVWYSRNMRLLSCHPIYIELGNEVFMDKTITGMRTVNNLEKAANAYCDLAEGYIKLLKEYGYKGGIGVCLAPEENNPYKAWNKVVRYRFGDSVAYVLHIYARPDRCDYTSVLALVNKRFGKYDRSIWVTEASWQFKDGIKDLPSHVAEFHTNLKRVLEDIGVDLLLWWRLGGMDKNKYNHFTIK